MKRLFLILGLLLIALPAGAITHVVQGDKNGCLACTPNLTLGAAPSAGHILLSFSRGDPGCAVVPSDNAGNVWNLLFADNGVNGVGVYKVYYAVSNGAAGAYHIQWSTTGFFTHAVGFIVETDITGVTPTVTNTFGTSNGFSVTGAQGTTFGMSVFGAGSVTWEATLLRLPIPGGWYVGYMSTNAGAPWNGGTRMNLAGTVDYLIDTWNGVFAVNSTDPSAHHRRSQVY
jgi:hypothetical protein